MTRLLPYLICLMIVTLIYKSADFDYKTVLTIIAASALAESKPAQSTLQEGKAVESTNEVINTAALTRNTDNTGEKAEKSEISKEVAPKGDSNGSIAKEIENGDNNFTDAEIDMLKNLRNRRLTIKAQEEELRIDMAMMNLVKKSIDEKMHNLEKLQESAKNAMLQYETKQNANITALVKIYENMKPKDAAKIFDTLQIGVLLDVSSRMQEQKLAQILGQMSPEQAKNLTIAMANHQKISDTIRNPILPFSDIIQNSPQR